MGHRTQRFDSITATCNSFEAKRVNISSIKKCVDEFKDLIERCVDSNWSQVDVHAFPDLSRYTHVTRLLQTVSIPDALSIHDMVAAMRTNEALATLIRRNSARKAKKGRQTMLAHFVGA